MLDYEAEKYLDCLPFKESLNKYEAELVKENLSVRNFKKGEDITSCCVDGCLGMLYVLSGAVRVSIVSEEGREVTLFTITAGEVCVLSAACVIHQITLETAMTAKTDVSLLVVSSSAIQSLMESNINVRCFVFEMATKRFSTAIWVLQEIIFSGFDKRLAEYLLRESQGNNSNTINMTQEEIAVEVGSSREVVTRMLKHFMNDDILIVKRGSIIIADKEALQRLAEAE